MSPSRSLVAVFAAALISPVFVGATAPASGVSQATAQLGTADLTTSVAPRVRQRAKLLMHPQIADPGKNARPAAKAKSSMTGKFTPRRKGRVVKLQNRSGTRWVTVQKGRQNGRGLVDFNALYQRNGNIQKYRVVAMRFDGLPKKASAGAATDLWGGHAFKDEFSGSTLGGAWADRVQGFGATPARKCSRTGAAATRRMVNGTLQLSVKKSAKPSVLSPNKCSYKGRKYVWRQNGHVSTESNGFSFTYGYAAARIKFQPKAGQHASFWMQPQDAGAASGTEIDVIEWFGNRRNNDTELSSFVHRDGTKVGGLIKNPGRFGSKWFKKYHVFSVDWSPSRYIFRIDGKETFRTSRFVSHTPEYLILSILSSDYELRFLKDETLLGKPATTAKFDWVRVWER